MNRHEFMQAAIETARQGIRDHAGGPFGTVIVKDGCIIAKAHNCVLRDNDPTAHGEITALRDAGRHLGSHDLKGCELYTTGEPCTMCLCACMWANIDRVYYGCTIADNALIGFRDAQFDEKFGGRETFRDFLIQLDREACLSLFEEYRQMKDAPRY
ncbi:MAG: nucleoside deaminase [Bacteroidales bacterium]|nr:nucleoside deaminase [Bacteroidales bacterium]